MRTTRWLAATLLFAFSATAQEARVEEFDPGGTLHPGWAYPHEFNVRMVGGGRNAANEAQTFTCSLEELEARKGRCSELPRDRKLEYGYPVRIEDANGSQMAEYLGGDLGWRIRPGTLAKSTQGLARIKYVKRSPGQGAIVSVRGVNSAQGDFMGLALDMNDLAGGQAGGDEGFMPLSIYMRDHLGRAAGSTIQRLRAGARTFRANPTGGVAEHDDQAAPRRLLVWTDGPRIAFDVSKKGHNPKPRPPKLGARWVLDSELAFPDGDLPATAVDVFGHERTDWCATLDATAYSDGSSDQKAYNYVLVSRFESSRRFVTHRLLQGQNAGIYENEYVRGFAAVDHAVNAGNTRGHLLPCSIITGYDTGQREFSIAPLIGISLAPSSPYVIPSMGSMGPEGIKVTYAFKLGTGGARTGIMANTLVGPDNRGGDRAFVAAGHWGEAFTSFDSDAMLHDYHPRYPAPKYVFARLRGSSSWDGHELQVWYPEPNGRGQARVQLPHYPGDSAFVLVSRGNGPPDGDCIEPGLQRYYDLSADREYICSSKLSWRPH